MGGQTFGIGERDGGRADGVDRGIAERDEAGAFHEIQNGKTGGEARAAPGREDVVRPGDVIADSLGSHAAKEHGPCMADLREQVPA